MPLKAILVANVLAATVIILKLLGTQSDISIAKLSKQSVE